MFGTLFTILTWTRAARHVQGIQERHASSPLGNEWSISRIHCPKPNFWGINNPKRKGLGVGHSFLTTFIYYTHALHFRFLSYFQFLLFKILTPEASRDTNSPQCCFAYTISSYTTSDRGRTSSYTTSDKGRTRSEFGFITYDCAIYRSFFNIILFFNLI